MADQERNRLTARARRYASVGRNVGGVAARMAGARFLGMDLDRAKNAAELAAALGGLKGPIMKVAQLLATIPEALPPEYITELTKLQSQAPPMGWAFVKRRMQAELGAGLAEANSQASSIIPPRPPRSARCIARTRMTARSSPASCNTPTCSRRSKPTSVSSVCCLRSGGGSIRRSTPPRSIKEIGARMREELDYRHEAKHAALYRNMLTDEDAVRVPQVVARAFDRPAAHARLARRHAGCSSTRTTRSPCAIGWPRRCSPPGGCRSAASA